MNEKEILIQNVNGAIPTAQKMKQLENEIDQLSAEIEQKKKFGCLWVVAFFFSFAFVISGVCFILAEEFGSMLFAFAVASLPVIFLILRLKRINACKSKIKELEGDIANMQNDTTLAWLPAEYRTGSCLTAIIGYVQNGRADSLKEAINLLENEMHQQRMENAAAVGAYIGAKSGKL